MYKMAVSDPTIIIIISLICDNFFFVSLLGLLGVSNLVDRLVNK